MCTKGSTYTFAELTSRLNPRPLRPRNRHTHSALMAPSNDRMEGAAACGGG